MRERSAGYSIVEMLASLVIMGMIGTLMVSGVTTGRRVWERMNTDNANAEDVGGAQLMLRQRIERTFPATRYDTIPPFADLDGEANTFTFLAEPRKVQQPSALRRYKIWLGPNGELMLSSVSDVAADATKADENLVLLRGVGALDLAYYGPLPPVGSAPSAGSDWQLRWQQRGAPPQLVRVHVEFDPGDRRIWPDLLVRPLVTIDTGCVLNSASGKCRGRP
jgi:general secretion pathway protein J